MKSIKFFIKLFNLKHSVLLGEDNKGTKRGNSKKNAAGMPYTIEYAKSSRATCRHCDIKICKVRY